MTKKDIIHSLAGHLGIHKGLAKEVVEAILEEIRRMLAEKGRLEIRNFGVFEVRKRAARKARNPRTNEVVQVPPRRVVVFQPGKLLADMVRDHPPRKPDRQRRPAGAGTPCPAAMPLARTARQR